MTSSTPPESPTSSSAIHYFTVPQWAVLILIILTGLLLRWIGLDVRPLHHDESLHAMYGKYYYDFSTACSSPYTCRSGSRHGLLAFPQRS
jgi:predicted membrane-bound mannosyltransferase